MFVGPRLVSLFIYLGNVATTLMKRSALIEKDVTSHDRRGYSYKLYTTPKVLNDEHSVGIFPLPTSRLINTSKHFFNVLKIIDVFFMQKPVPWNDTGGGRRNIRTGNILPI